MKKFDNVVSTVIAQIKSEKVEGKICRSRINKIVDEVCEAMNFKGNEFSILYTLGLA